MTGYFLGGVLAPLGLSVGFVHRPFAEVREALLTWRRQELGQVVDELGPSRFPDCTAVLDPLEAPWTTEVLIASGPWTTYLNNGIDGGDPTAAAPYLGKRLGCDCVIAMSSPMHGPGNSSTQLWMKGPGGELVRTIAAHAAGGRWSWATNGAVQPFEQPERYTARRIRARFDRALLVAYLAAMGIRVDDVAFYGEGMGVRQVVSYRRRQETAAQVRARFGW